MINTHGSGTSSNLEPIENGTSASWFLEQVFGCVSEYESGTRVCLFEGRNNRTTRFSLDEFAAVDAFVDANKKIGAIYFNTGLQNLPLSPWARGDRGEVYAITSLSADLDLFKDDAKKKYPTFDVAMAVLKAMPLAPSMIVFSGRGLYPLWLLQEPLIVGNDLAAADDLATRLTKAWQALLLRRLQDIDPACAMDSTGDLTRMLRVPGSVNTKAGCAVSVITNNGLRYNEGDFAPYLPIPLSRPRAARDGKCAVTPERVRIDIERTDKFQALLANDARFAATWLQKRPEFGSDVSRYCMSLTDAAVRAGWSDKEIDDLRHAWCTKHDRTSSYQLRKSLHDIGKKRTEIEMIAVETDTPVLPGAPASNITLSATAAGDSALSTIRRALRHNGIVRVIQRGIERATFDLVFLHDGEEVIVNIGKARDVFTPRVVQAAVAERLHHTIKARTKARWEPVAAAIFQAAEVVHTTTATERLFELLAVFGRRARGSRSFVDVDPEDLPIEQECGNNALKHVWPEAFLSKDGRLFISLAAFVSYINSSFLGGTSLPG